MPSQKTTGRKWGPQQRANFIASMKARREAIAKGLEPPIAKYKQSSKTVDVPKLVGPLSTSKEAIIYLQHAERIAINNVRTGKQKVLSQDQLYMLLALNCLRGQL